MVKSQIFKSGFPVFLCFCLLIIPSCSLARQVILPLTLDYKLLSSLLVKNVFTGKDNSFTVEENSCTRVKITDPVYSAEGENLRLEMRLAVDFGSPVGGKCFLPLKWDGYIVFLQQPVFDGENFSLSFRTVDSKLYSLEHKPATLAGLAWKFIQSSVYPRLNRVGINLAPPVTHLKNFLRPLFPHLSTQVTDRMLDSLRGGRVMVRDGGLLAELVSEVESVYEPAGEDRPLTPAETRDLVGLWETWDVFLVQLVTAIGGYSTSDSDQQILVDVLLSARYEFSAALAGRRVGRDFVRIQFLDAWKRLAPIFRKQLYSGDGENGLGYLAFFTAADALEVFDKMGPTIGIEISRQGLLRLARMLDGKVGKLRYVPDVDSRLRNLLELPRLQERSQPLPEEPGIDLDDVKKEPLSLFRNVFVTPVCAEPLPGLKEILKWKVPKKNIESYVLRVRKVLDGAIGRLLGREQIPASLHGAFREMINAMAWQESCLRQFVVKNRKLTYLLSYNRSSVGIMQVNERVWRGLYDRGRLRWDIRYNALAGCEIADLYLRKYVLAGRKKSVPDKDLIVRTVYAMYNGGPGQYSKFLVREKKKRHFRSDLLFAEKLSWVRSGKWQNLSLCLLGG
ncbi:lytic transglycosylase domain-containing protein [Desulfomarina sp.]